MTDEKKLIAELRHPRQRNERYYEPLCARAADEIERLAALAQFEAVAENGALEYELSIWANECAEKIGVLNGLCEETPPIIVRFLRDAFLAGLNTAMLRVRAADKMLAEIDKLFDETETDYVPDVSAIDVRLSYQRRPKYRTLSELRNAIRARAADRSGK